MGVNQQNALNALANLKTYLTGLEGGHNINTGEPSLDQETRRLLLMNIMPFVSTILDFGSRSEATAAAAARKASTGVQGQVHEQLHNLDMFIKQIDAATNALNNDLAASKRSHNTLN
jgi:hypothetical protein